MKWVKKGNIFNPNKMFDWLCSHAMTPFADKIGDETFRVYFSGRDIKGRAQLGFFTIDMSNPGKNIYVNSSPLIALGPLGSFDDSGITSPWIVNHNGLKYLYYAGWSLGKTVPFYFYVGLATSEDDGNNFFRFSNSPILERNMVDPYLTGSPCILIENSVWKMWYVSCTKWDLEDDQSKHHYHIKYAESFDGLYWDRKGIISIDYQSSDEYAIARPCVIKEDDTYKMWYSYRGKSYRIGYAESEDGTRWERKDSEVGIDVSKSGWDSEMIEYPFVFDHKGERYMLYNGNGYGKTGIGLAVLSED